MRFKRGDFLEIPTDGTYRCIIADDEIAVFAAWRYGKIHPEFLRIRTQAGGVVNRIDIVEPDLVNSFRDNAHKTAVE